MTWCRVRLWMFPLVSTILTLSMDNMVISAEIVSLFFKYTPIKTMNLNDHIPQVQDGEQHEVDRLLHEAGLVLFPSLLLHGFFPMFEDWSKVKLVVAQH